MKSRDLIRAPARLAAALLRWVVERVTDPLDASKLPADVLDAARRSHISQERADQ